MKSSLRLTIQIIVGIFAFFFLIPVFLPSGYNITVSKFIRTKPAVVFNQVNNLHNRNAWSPFDQNYSLKSQFSGPEAGVGAKRIWANKSEKGSIEIIRSEPDSLIDTRMNFGTPGTATGHWTFKKEDNGTKVTWQLHIHGLKYPFGKWLGLFLRKSIKEILGSGLDALKIVSEKEPAKGKAKKQTSGK